MALSKGVAIDAEDDESAWQKTVREFEITNVGEFRVGHEVQEGNYRGNPGEERLTGGSLPTTASSSHSPSPLSIARARPRQVSVYCTFSTSNTDNMSLSLPQNPSDHNQHHTCPPTHNTRPASPFFRHRPLGRAPSPPTWACYEQIPARSDLLGSSDSDSDSGEAADDDSLSDADSSSSSSSSSSSENEEGDEREDPQAETEADVQAAGLMDVESDKGEEATSPRSHRHPASGDPEKRDKGKQRADDPPNTVSGSGNSVPVSHSRSRRPRGRRPPVSALRPILTIQRSQGFVWNQVSVSLVFFSSRGSSATAARSNR